jgi:hypothetical protein
MNSTCQDLEKHQWKNRVLLIYGDEKTNTDFTKQMKILSENKKGLIERKLKLYQFIKNQFTFDFDEGWISSNLLFKNYVNNNERFKVILIGLDGGVKLTQNSILSTEKLFAIIDGMPMRKRELKNKN